MRIKNQKTAAVFAAEVMDFLRRKAVGSGAVKRMGTTVFWILGLFCISSSVFSQTQHKKIKCLNMKELRAKCGNTGAAKFYHVRMDNHNDYIYLEYDGERDKQLDIRKNLKILSPSEKNADDYVINAAMELRYQKTKYIIVRYYLKHSQMNYTTYVIYDVTHKKIVPSGYDDYWNSSFSSLDLFYIDKKDKKLHFWILDITPNDDSNKESIIHYRIDTEGKFKVVGHQEVLLCN